MKRFLLATLTALLVIPAAAQPPKPWVDEAPVFIDNYFAPVRNEMRIADIPGYVTLTCDLHIHTIFSDGNVTPALRVKEAWRSGLDVMAVTEHLEYQPWVKQGLMNDQGRNRAYEIALKTVQDNGYDMLIIPGTEITKNKPFGHMNALFVQDVDKFDTQDPHKAIDEALRQEAFITWNHPGWPDKKATKYEVHDRMIAEGKIHGVEFVNHREYYPPAVAWCKEYNLCYIAASDIHETIWNDLGEYPITPRPMTLVFARERSVESVKEAMFARRTVALVRDVLFGPPTLLQALMEASLEYRFATRSDKNQNTYIDVYNNSDIPFRVLIDGRPAVFHAGKTTRIVLPDSQTEMTVTNCFITADENLVVPAPKVEIPK